MSDNFPMELGAESVSINQVGTGEWEIAVSRPDTEDPLVVYVDMIDPLFDQLAEQGELEW